VESYKTIIEEGLRSALSTYLHPGQLYDPIRYLIEGGGKRIRPLLTLLACETACAEAGRAVNAAIAVEMLHAFTLVHDDIMDNSEIRRGRLTVHKKWNANAAILTGDVMIGIALRLLGKDAHHCVQPLKVFDAFTNGLIRVCEGQALDMWHLNSPHVTSDDYLAMIDLKTAKLLETAVEVGACIGNASDQHITALKEFAHDIGLAFQLNDDLLDLTGGEQFGKTAGGDIVQGKRTWLMITLRDSVRGEQDSSVVSEFFENNGLHRSRIPEVRSLMETYGILDRARALIESLTLTAQSHLSAVPDCDARKNLERLTLQLMERQH
jgi:geranylgeranyl diphosphate synthase type II